MIEMGVLFTEMNWNPSTVDGEHSLNGHSLAQEFKLLKPCGIHPVDHAYSTSM